MRIVYTAIFGDYDELKEPLVITPNTHYICFSDKYIESKVWEHVHVTPKYDSVRQARHVKLMIHEYVKFTQAIWIDANQQITMDLTKLFEKNVEIEMLQHPDRYCIYEEARECQRLNKDNWEIIRRQMEIYFTDGYPINNGLVATGLIVRNNSEKIKTLCKHWFEEVLYRSKRDQLSFNYVLSETRLESRPQLKLYPFELLTEIAKKCKHKK